MPWARLAVVTLALASAGCAGGGSKHTTGLSWSVDKSPFALHVQSDGEDVLADATGDAAGPGTRLSYTLRDGSAHMVTNLESSRPVAGGTEYRLQTDEDSRTATLTVRRAKHSLHVAWRLVPDTNVDTVFTAFTGPKDASEHFLGSGIQHTQVDLTGQAVQMKVAYSCARSIVTPFFVSSAGYGVWFDTNAVGHMQFHGTHDGMACNDSNSANPLCAIVGAADRVQACFKTASLDYDVFVGTPVQVVSRFRVAAGRIPVPSTAELGAIKWRDRVAGRAELLDDAAQFRRLHIPLTTVLLDNPWEPNGCWGTLRFDPRFGDPSSLARTLHEQGLGLMVWVSPWVSCASSGFAGEQSLETPQGWRAVDFTNPAARAAYEAKITALARVGVDGFKGDRGDETDLESLQFAGGPGRAVNNVFPQLFAQAVLSAKRPISMFRAGWTDTPTTGAGVWTGDQIPDFGGLQDAIRSLASLGASGFAIAGSDVGGYATQDGSKILTPEVFARWTQLGAVSPIFELGGADRAAEFWRMGPAATAAARDSITLHYQLVPYLSALARTSAATGAPIIRPLALQYPDDAASWRADLELLVGPDLLAAPVTSQTTTPLVYLPAGSWVDLFSGRTVRGGRSVVRPIPLSEFPLYLRAGATIPFTPRTGAVQPLTTPGREGLLTTRSTLAVAHAQPTSVLLVRPRRPRAVTVDGRPARFTWSRAPFPAALVRLPAGAGRVTVSAR